MKRHLTDLEKQKLLNDFKSYLDNVTDGKVSFTKEIKPQNKIKIFYTPEAYSKTVRLITSHSMEIAWHCLVRKKDQDYEVYDILSYPQTVGPAHVHVRMGRTFGDGQPKDPTKFYNDWYNEVVLNMSEEDEANLCGQCHSHVNMGTFPSSTDINQQKEELQLKGGTGYYLFQIWNKKLEVNTFLYDLDAGVLYEKDDVEIVVEEDDFTIQSHNMLFTPPPEEKKPEPEKKSVEKDADSKKKSFEKVPAKELKQIEHDSWDCYDHYPYEDDDDEDLLKYIVCVEHEQDFMEYVIEAHNGAEADWLFRRWINDNANWVLDEMGLEGTCTRKDLKIYPAEPAAEDEIVDIDYVELTGEYYESV